MNLKKIVFGLICPILIVINTDALAGGNHSNSSNGRHQYQLGPMSSQVTTQYLKIHGYNVIDKIRVRKLIYQILVNKHGQNMWIEINPYTGNIIQETRINNLNAARQTLRKLPLLDAPHKIRVPGKSGSQFRPAYPTRSN